MNPNDQSKTITVEVAVKSPIEDVWRFFTNPAHITQWHFASDEWHAPAANNDLSLGGKFLTRMESKDGIEGFDFEGIYLDVEKNELIKYILPDGREVEVVFFEKDNQTIVREVFDPEDENSEELQKSGWQAILYNFKKYCESGKNA